MARRWAKPKERGTAGQRALPGFVTCQATERARIDTMPVALGPVDTSREAAAAAQNGAAGSRKLILSLIRGAGERGVTCDEVSAATGRTPNQVSGRFTELARLRLIQRAGSRRKTRAGAEAHVWVAVSR
jgi:hypothetical protein